MDSSMTGARVRAQARLLIVPGLRNSGPLHWQSWLQSLHRNAVRVNQDDWDAPELDAWAARIASTIEDEPEGSWIVAAHSFGCLALVRCLALQEELAASLVAALLVAPADPEKFAVSHLVPHLPLAIPTTLVASETDPWMRLQSARLWAQRWGCEWINLGDAGHVNSASGHGPLPLAQRWLSKALAEAQARARPLSGVARLAGPSAA
jgi:predicted alpha/beta hydrolase family esterase